MSVGGVVNKKYASILELVATFAQLKEPKMSESAKYFDFWGIKCDVGSFILENGVISEDRDRFCFKNEKLYSNFYLKEFINRTLNAERIDQKVKTSFHAILLRQEKSSLPLIYVFSNTSWFVKLLVRKSSDAGGVKLSFSERVADGFKEIQVHHLKNCGDLSLFPGKVIIQEEVEVKEGGFIDTLMIQVEKNKRFYVK